MLLLATPILGILKVLTQQANITNSVSGLDWNSGAAAFVSLAHRGIPVFRRYGDCTAFLADQ
jgi:hypothetical protein